jgi:preprotein translocase SecF subunit
MGAFAVTYKEFSLTTNAAILTVVGYSMNDTIVVFDRIRETRGRGPRKGQSLADLINGALNQTLSRTILTSFTTFLAAFVLYLFGGEVLHDFAFALVVGVVTGTYSSVAAATLVMDWELWSRRRSPARAKVAVKADQVVAKKP